ncbi:MAG: TonB-dependent receptor [Bacteroidales bacterium]|nr:TonB-dependent receptor [Bacteroidales bacterium]MDZ4204812.1 TonB-dependent receptor [Bacteroidales bacterium]
MLQKYYQWIGLILFALLGSQILAQQNTAIVFGKVTTANRKPIELANVRLLNLSSGTVTDSQGNYELRIPAGMEVALHFTFLGFAGEYATVTLEVNEKRRIDVMLRETTTFIPGPVIEDQHVRTTSLTRIDPRLAVAIPSISGSVESLIKTMPGVSSSNELSSQYSVRGGNFDENLVYVNDIEIYRPFLIRSGQQEGLSFLNSDLVSSILFSAGGFDAKYGDKMASVLDIQYKKPRERAGSFSASFLGAAAHLEGISKNNKFTYLTGVRYKSNQYILKAMETKGEYKPSFTDIQAYISWEPYPKFELAFLGNYANNNYKVVPTDRETSFGTINEAYKFKVYFEGKEIDRFENYMGALSFRYKPHNRLNLKVISSAYRSLESETYDLLGQYWIGRLESDFGSGEYGQVVEAIGVGSYLNHARNYLDAKVYSIEHRGNYSQKFSIWQWGAKFQHESIYDRINEWELIDSAGYSIPRTADIPGIGNVNPSFEINSVVRATNDLGSNRYSAFMQNLITLDGEQDRLHLTAGVRINYWDLNKQTLVSPRATLSYKPEWQKDIVLRFSAGYYFQPPFYRELRDFKGTLNLSLKAQSSIHIVAGSDWNFLAWDRPFKFVSEVYYKYLDNLVPYEIDNVRIRYYATNSAKGFATGIDLKVNGEFVSGIDSWASLSVMKTMEDIKDDFYYRYFDEKGKVVFQGSAANIVDSVRIEPGFIPRPTDQRVNFSLMFQDYLPSNPTYKMHLSLLFGSGLTFGAPGSPKYRHTFRIPPYRRVDIGFSKQIISEETRLRDGHPMRHFKSLWVSFEVFNLLQVNNTVSYIWISDVNNRRYGVPNYLTPRQVNLKLQASF